MNDRSTPDVPSPARTRRWLRSIAATLALLVGGAAGFTLAGCETIEGAGEDIEDAGEGLEEAVEE